MTLSGLRHEAVQFIVFSGKGGAGKTTMAAATALELAKEKKVLISTTGPAPSLSNSFGQRIGDEPTAVAGIENLFGMEIDGKKVMEEFKKEYGGDILDILQQGSYLSKRETEEMFRLDIPGLEELVSLKKITNFMESSDYQLYIVDTAPTIHTLKLLLLPDLLDNWIKFFAKLRWKHQAVIRVFAGAKYIEKADKFLLEMKKTVKRVKGLLLSAEKTEFVVVTLAEKMAISETEELVSNLERMHIPSRHLIINSILPQEAPVSVEQWDRRKTPRASSELPFFNAAVYGGTVCLGKNGPIYRENSAV